MKKVIIVCFIMVASSITGKAQYFVAGELGFGLSNGKRSEGGVTEDSPSSTSFNFSPALGYWLNDKIAVGAGAAIGVLISSQKKTDPLNPEKEIEFKQNTPNWGVSAFCRNKLLGSEKFSFLLQNSIGFYGSSTIEKYGTEKKKTFSGTSLYIQVRPIVSYQLNEKFCLEGVCDFLDLAMYSNTKKNEVTGRKDTYNHINFGVQSTLLNSLTNIRISFLYNF